MSQNHPSPAVFLSLVDLEISAARAKFSSSQCSLAALMEEVGELAKAMLEESRERVVEEAVQVATMAARIALEGDPTMEPYRFKRNLGPLVPCMVWPEPAAAGSPCIAWPDPAAGGSPQGYVPAFSLPAEACTCPSGEGSIRWPCPVHPPTLPARFEWRRDPHLPGLERLYDAVEARFVDTVYFGTRSARSGPEKPEERL